MKYLLKYWYWILAVIIWSAIFVGFRWSDTTTDSMEPTYKVGRTWEIMVPVSIEKPQVGDVIGFECLSEKCPYTERIAHRLVAIQSNGCMVIVGDNPKYDWAKEPCYMPEDIHIFGVSHKL